MAAFLVALSAAVWEARAECHRPRVMQAGTTQFDSGEGSRSAVRSEPRKRPLPEIPQRESRGFANSEMPGEGERVTTSTPAIAVRSSKSRDFAADKRFPTLHSFSQLTTSRCF